MVAIEIAFSTYAAIVIAWRGKVCCFDGKGAKPAKICRVAKDGSFLGSPLTPTPTPEVEYRVTPDP